MTCASRRHLGILINREFLSTEILRTLAGSIGIVASVPVTTALAALLCHEVADWRMEPER